MSIAARSFRFGFVPVFALVYGGWAIELSQRGASPPTFALLLLAALATCLAAERIAPYERAWNRPNGDRGRDAAHVLVNESLAAASVATLPLAYGLFDFPSNALWPAHWPFGLQVLAALLVLDLGITFTHAASHRVAWLWRFHAVHHSVTRMYGPNGILKHPVHQTIEMAVGTLPLLLLGLPRSVACALAVLTALQLLLQHANVDVDTGPLRRWHAGAELHRLHHRRAPGRGDVNFGLFTTLGDRILRTLDLDLAERVADGDLGIEAEPDYPRAYLDQLIRPFRRNAPS